MSNEPDNTPVPPERALTPRPPEAPPVIDPVVPSPALPPTSKLSKLRISLAFVIAGLADAISALLIFAPPIELVVDLVTALLLFAVLGRRWMLLPGLIMEAIPGLYVFPVWVLVVGAIVTWGTIRPNLK